MAGSCVKAATKRRMSDPTIQAELFNIVVAPNLTLQKIRLRVLNREMINAIDEITQAKYQQYSLTTP